VLGLRRALQVAGVRTAAMSLWKVDDRAARAQAGRPSMLGRPVDRHDDETREISDR
jgi:hypothetical protein